MSTGFGVKGKDGKYNTLNLTSYKGRSVDSSKPSAGSSLRHGLQSLGKVASARRVPKPASLPSLKSENLGNDPNINLVPKDGSGWASKTETASTAQNQSQESQQRQASSTCSPQTATSAMSQTTANSRNVKPTSAASTGTMHHPTWGPSHRMPAGSRASGAVGGGLARGTTHSSEDFPVLGGPPKDGQTDLSRDLAYGPGPSLRPQNVASWREGGGRNLPPKADDSEPAFDGGKKSSDNEATASRDDLAPCHPLDEQPESASTALPTSQRNSTNQHPSSAAIRPNAMAQPHMNQYPPNMMPYAHMNYRFPHPMMNQPGARYPVNMHPGMQFPGYRNDPRFRGMMMGGNQRPPSQQDIERMEKFEEDGGNWAAMQGEVDYGEKLVFSDDEDNPRRGVPGEDRHRKPSDGPSKDAGMNHARQSRMQPPYDQPHPMQAWPPAYAGMYGNQQHNQPGSEFRSNKPIPGHGDRRMPPQGYAAVPPHNIPPFGQNPDLLGQQQRFPAPQHHCMDSSSPGVGGDAKDEQSRRNEKEEAVERAKKRREEEERRMELEQRGDPHHRQQDHEIGEDGRPWAEYHNSAGNRPNLESKDRMPGDGYGGYRGTLVASGRNLPPRLAQRQQQGDARANIRHPSIMKREPSESSEEPTANIHPPRPTSEGSASALQNDRFDDRQRFYNRESRKEDSMLNDETRSLENVSPSAGSERELRMLDVGKHAQQPLKRPLSRDSPTTSVTSSNSSRRGSQKLSSTANDLGNKTANVNNNKWNVSSFDKTEVPASGSQQTVRSRRLDKVKLRDFRVDDGEDADVPVTPAKPFRKTDRNNTQTKQDMFDEVEPSSPVERRPWNNLKGPIKPKDGDSKGMATIDEKERSTSVIAKTDDNDRDEGENASETAPNNSVKSTTFTNNRDSLHPHSQSSRENNIHTSDQHLVTPDSDAADNSRRYQQLRDTAASLGKRNNSYRGGGHDDRPGEPDLDGRDDRSSDRRDGPLVGSRTGSRDGRSGPYDRGGSRGRGGRSDRGGHRGPHDRGSRDDRGPPHDQEVHDEWSNRDDRRPHDRGSRDNRGPPYHDRGAWDNRGTPHDRTPHVERGPLHDRGSSRNGPTVGSRTGSRDNRLPQDRRGRDDRGPERGNQDGRNDRDSWQEQPDKGRKGSTRDYDNRSPVPHGGSVGRGSNLRREINDVGNRGGPRDNARNTDDQSGSRPRSDKRRDPKKGFERYESKGRSSSNQASDQRNTNTPKTQPPAKSQAPAKGTGEKPRACPATDTTFFKPTPAAPPPSTNVWEERKRQMEKEVVTQKSLTYIPTEEDKKRTLKETALTIKKTDKPVHEPSADTKRPTGEPVKEPRFKDRDFRARPDAERRKCDDGKSYGRGEHNNRAPSPPPPSQRREQSLYDASERRGRGRGRSRGGYNSSRGGGRGFSSTDKPLSFRGRGRRGARSAPTPNLEQRVPQASQGKQSYDDGTEYTDSMTDETSVSDGYEPGGPGRRRQLGEGSDAEGHSSDDESASDDEKLSTRKHYKSHASGGSRTLAETGSGNRVARFNGVRESGVGGGGGAFAARGAPSRRGRGGGRGYASSSRGRGRGGGGGGERNPATASAPPSARTRGEDAAAAATAGGCHHKESSYRYSKNGERAPRNGGLDKKRRDQSGNDKRKRRGKAERPPRFKNPVKTSESAESVSKPIQDNNTQHTSSDVGADDWETASDNSAEFRKNPPPPPPPPLEQPLRTTEQPPKRNESKKSFSGQRISEHRRGGRGGRGSGNSARQNNNAPAGKNESQVYMLHTVKYNDPSAIAGALASVNGANKNKHENVQKEKKKELFRMYDLNNYASVVNVDDLPEVSGQSVLKPMEGSTQSNTLQQATDNVPHHKLSAFDNDHDDDGFTPVLSKRAQKNKKLQEEKKKETLKKEEQQIVMEAVRKVRIDQQRQNRQKLFNKSTGQALNAGTSGSVRQPSQPVAVATTEKSSMKEMWGGGVAPAPWDGAKDYGVSVKSTVVTALDDVSTELPPGITSNDSGVDTSVPSSQRSSPGTEAKLAFSHFGGAITSTSVVTSICNQQVSESVVTISSSSDTTSGFTTTQISDLTIQPSNNIAAEEQQLSSPSRSTPQHRINPIGNERPKPTSQLQSTNKQSASVENLTTLFPTMNDQNVISFIADSSAPSIDESKGLRSTASPPLQASATNNMFSSEEIASSTFPQFGEPQEGQPIKQRSKFTNYQQQSEEEQMSNNFSGADQASSAGDLASSPRSVHSNMSSSTQPPPTSMQPFIESIQRNSFMPISQTVMAPDFIPASAGALIQGGINPKPEPSQDMTLNPQQASSNPNVTHLKNNALDGGNNIPQPIPLPPTKHAESPAGADGDNKAGIRPGAGSTVVSASAAATSADAVTSNNANGAGDMGLLTPTSPSVDLNMKMESARKAWENMPESSNPSSQQQQTASNENFFHSAGATDPTESDTSISSMPSATLSVTKSSEWKPASHRNPTSSAVSVANNSEQDDSWSQQNNSTPAPSTQQPAESQDPAQITSANRNSPPHSHMSETQITNGNFSHAQTAGGGVSIATTNNSAQLINPYNPSGGGGGGTPSPGSGGYMYLLDQTSQLFAPQQRVAVPQAQQSAAALYQPISSTSLASNLHQIQQAYSNVPPEYGAYTSQNPYHNTSLAIQQPSQTGFSSQAREFTPIIMASTTLNNSAAKPGSAVTTKATTSNPYQQVGHRSSGLTTAFGSNSLSGVNQQTNIATAQYSMTRPHSGAPSPHAVLIPVVDQSRTLIGSSQSTAIVNQQMNRQQQTPSYHSQQAASNNYYSQQPNIARQPTTYQQAAGIAPQAVSFQQQNLYNPMKAMSPAPQATQLGLEHMAIGGSAAAGMQQQQSLYPNTARMREGEYQYPYTYSHSAPYPNKTVGGSGAFPGAAASTKQLASTSHLHGGSMPFDPLKQSNQQQQGALGYGGSNMKPQQLNLYAPAMQKPESSTSNQFAKYATDPAASNKSYLPTDWSKQQQQQNNSTSQYRTNSVQGILSRPFSSSMDTSYQQASMQSSYKPHVESQQVTAAMSYAPQHQQPRFDTPSQSLWGVPKPPMSQVGGAGIMGAQPSSISLLGKPPSRPLLQAPMMNQQRFPAQGYQAGLMQTSPAARSPFQAGQPPTSQSMPGVIRMQSPTSAAMQQYGDASRQSPGDLMTSHFQPPPLKPPTSSQQQQQAKKVLAPTKPGGSGGGPGKAPPVPTLVRGAGSNLVGRKPSHLPEEVVKSNQASERASLLQSLSGFFPDKQKKQDAEEAAESKEPTDWSTKVANSSPLPQRKPGMRHPGVEPRPGKPGDHSRRGGEGKSRRGSRNGKKPAMEAVAAEPVAPSQPSQQQQPPNVVKPPTVAKKLTLADTKPKKGEVSKINLREGGGGEG